MRLRLGLGGREQRAAEHAMSRVRRLLAIEQRDQRGAARVVAGMPARAGDAAAEEQLAAGVVQERLPGCRRAEPLRLAPSSSRTTVTLGSADAVRHRSVFSQPSKNCDGFRKST